MQEISDWDFISCNSEKKSQNWEILNSQMREKKSELRV